MIVGDGPGPVEPTLVVDLGSWGVSAALVTEDGAATLTEPGGTAMRWPAAVCLGTDGLVLGSAAERVKRSWPSSYSPDVAAAAAGSALAAACRTVGGADLLRAVFAHLREHVAADRGLRSERLVATVPHDIEGGLRDVFRAAGEAAGFLDVELLDETVAVGLDPALPAEAQAATRLVVCDVGESGSVGVVLGRGGTTAVAEVRGVPGGADLHTALRAVVLDVERTWFEHATRAGGDDAQRARIDIDDFVTRLRHTLSDATYAEDAPGPLAPPFWITREGYAGLVAEPIEQVRAAVDALSSRALGRHPVVLVGGGARTPVVLDALRAVVSSRRLHVPPQPELSVLRGAAAWAGAAVRRRIRAEIPRWRERPLTWTPPDGHARLLQWHVAPGGRVSPGRVVASVRAADDSVVGLLATRAGTLRRHLVGVGGSVVAEPAAVVQEDLAAAVVPPRPARLPEVRGALVRVDRDTLVVVDGRGPAEDPLRVRTIAMTPELQTVTSETLVTTDAAYLQGAFRGPNGRPVLVLESSADHVIRGIDLTTRRSVFRLESGPGHAGFEVDEDTWDLWHHEAGGERAARWSLAQKGRWRIRPQRTDTYLGVQPGVRPGDAAVTPFRPVAHSPDGLLMARCAERRFVLARAMPGGGIETIMAEFFAGRTAQGSVHSVLDVTLPVPGSGVLFSADGRVVAVHVRENGTDRVWMWRL